MRREDNFYYKPTDAMYIRRLEKRIEQLEEQVNKLQEGYGG
jgi:hypothetical protein